MTSNEIIYLDHNATTPCDPRVVEAMLPYLTETFWNASSSHVLGRRASQAIGDAREIAAQSLGVDDENLIFTSGSTEALQLAIERLPIPLLLKFGIAVAPVEHRAVLNAAARVQQEGIVVDKLPVSRGGIVEIEAIDRPSVYVIQAANSETGVVQPLKEIYAQVQNVGGLLISDATQALWKLPPSQFIDCADGLVFSAHKAYGPKGIGLLIATNSFRKTLRSSFSQEAQEGGIREGTSNVPGIIGFSKTLDIVSKEGMNWRINALQRRDEFENLIRRCSGERIVPNFADLPRLPNTSSIWFKGIPGDLLMANLRTLALSYGSACSSGSFEPSQALIASGLDRKVAEETLRASFGRETSTEALEKAVSELCECMPLA